MKSNHLTDPVMWKEVDCYHHWCIQRRDWFLAEASLEKQEGQRPSSPENLTTPRLRGVPRRQELTSHQLMLNPFLISLKMNKHWHSTWSAINLENAALAADSRSSASIQEDNISLCQQLLPNPCSKTDNKEVNLQRTRSSISHPVVIHVS